MSGLDQPRELENSVVLVTGGTGSFGSTMARYLLTKKVDQVRIFSRDEAKQDALRHSLADDRVKFFIGDTRDFGSVFQATKGVDYVFHAAALKQVPTAEFFPMEAVRTNVVGSANVIRASIDNEVASLVCLSTDKAVYPINAMGMSKALMEKTAQSHAREGFSSRTRVAITRYGNVMYSRGSVIPLFISQIKSGKRLTITEPQMTRFLMSLDESVELVEHAMMNSATGDLFVRKAPAATVYDLAQALIEIFSGDTNQIEIIGRRHGEKVYESLLSSEERGLAIDEGQYFRVPLDTRNLNYSLFFESGQVFTGDHEAYTSHNTDRLSVEQIKSLLLTLPEIREELSK